MKKLKNHFIEGFIIHLFSVIVFFGFSAINSLIHYSDITHFLVHGRSGIVELTWWQFYLITLVLPVFCSITQLFDMIKKWIYRKKNIS